MTKFHARLLLPLDEQADRPGDRIDPAGLKFDPEETHTIFRGFNFNVPDDVLGSGKISRNPDGGLDFEGDLLDEQLFGTMKLSVGAAINRRDAASGLVLDSDLVVVAATDHHPDPRQPFIEKET